MQQDAALPEESGPPFEMFGISGSYDSTPAQYRNKGIDAAITGRPEIILRQNVYAYWDEKKAYDITSGLINRYPNTKLVWCAGGAMTHGTLNAIKDSHKIPGKDILLGTFDWSSSTANHIEEGVIAASVGGHFMDGGWSLILLYDYHHGIDFKDYTGTTILSPLTVMNPNNLSQYEILLNKNSWQDIDFIKFTKTHAGKEKIYNLSIDALLE